MAVTVVIQRTVKNRGMAEKLAALIVQLRSRAAAQPGFLTSQTFSCLDCEGEYLIISSWNTIKDWNRWMNSQERSVLQKQVDELLGESTRYRYYEPVIGGIPPGFGS